MRHTIMRPGLPFIACLLLMWTGCDAFLEPNPASFSTTANFYETPTQFEAAINGVYARFRTAVGDEDYRYMTDLRGPNLTRHFDVNLPHTVAGTPQLDEFTMTVDNGVSERTWTRLYQAIKEANVVISRIEGVEFADAALKDRIIGEAKAMRAFAYWAGAQFWGDLPIVVDEITTPAEAVPEAGRQAVGSVYQQVISDLQDAISKLPASYSGSNVGRITSGAARMLLGRTYLVMGDYQNALSTFQAIDQSGAYSLLGNYRDVFDPGNKNNAESIWELQYNPNFPGQGDPDNLMEDIVPWNSGSDLIDTNAGNPRGVYLPTPDIIDSYEAGDLRRDASIAWYVKAGNADFVELARGDSLPILNKFYFREYMNAQGYNSNWIVFRFSDVLLSAAEAAWRLGQDGVATGYLERVRSRANLGPVNLANYSGDLTGSPLGDAILHERSVELLGEAHHWLDLLRFGHDVAMKVMVEHGERFRARDPKTADVYVIQAFKLLYPIPIRDTDLAGLTQNQGW